jgi:hypothetical protein
MWSALRLHRCGHQTYLRFCSGDWLGGGTWGLGTPSASLLIVLRVFPLIIIHAWHNSRTAGGPSMACDLGKAHASNWRVCWRRTYPPPPLTEPPTRLVEDPLPLRHPHTQCPAPPLCDTHQLAYHSL